MAFPRKPSIHMKYRDEEGNIHQFTKEGWKLISTTARRSVDITTRKKKIRPQVFTNENMSHMRRGERTE